MIQEVTGLREGPDGVIGRASILGGTIEASREFEDDVSWDLWSRYFMILWSVSTDVRVERIWWDMPMW